MTDPSITPRVAPRHLRRAHRRHGECCGRRPVGARRRQPREGARAVARRPRRSRVPWLVAGAHGVRRCGCVAAGSRGARISPRPAPKHGPLPRPRLVTRRSSRGGRQRGKHPGRARRGRAPATGFHHRVAPGDGWNYASDRIITSLRFTSNDALEFDHCDRGETVGDDGRDFSRCGARPAPRSGTARADLFGCRADQAGQRRRAVMLVERYRHHSSMSRPSRYQRKCSKMSVRSCSSTSYLPRSRATIPTASASGCANRPSTDSPPERADGS